MRQPPATDSHLGVGTLSWYLQRSTVYREPSSRLSNPNWILLMGFNARIIVIIVSLRAIRQIRQIQIVRNK